MQNLSNFQVECSLPNIYPKISLNKLQQYVDLPIVGGISVGLVAKEMGFCLRYSKSRPKFGYKKFANCKTNVWTFDHLENKSCLQD